jgi:glycosyltransferase involved in cell wall biosynthesis
MGSVQKNKSKNCPAFEGRCGLQTLAGGGCLAARAARYDRRNLSYEGADGMRIVYVLTSLGIGGAERQALELAARMQRRGHAVALVVLREPLAGQREHWEHSGAWPNAALFEHLGMRRQPLSFLLALARAAEIVRRFRAEIVHSHSFHANIFARLASMRQRSTPLVCTVHNVYEGAWPRMLAYRLTDRLCAKTTAVSQAAAQRFMRLGAIPRHKCAVVVNGVDVDRLAANAGRRAQMRAEMAAGGDFVWLAAGRIVAAKDYPNLLRAFALAQAACGGVVLWIAGEAKDGADLPLRALAAELGIAGRVQWLGLRRDLPALLDAADGFVLASAWEGMPLALAEAMAMEKPVAATDVGGVRELVGEAGRIVPARDAGALGNAMAAVMRMSAEERAALGRSARERMIRHFSMDARARDWERLYEEMIASV